MKRIIRYLWLSVFLASPGLTAAAGPSGLTMYHAQAGTQETDGWYTARSSYGGFAVRLPLPYNDFSVPAAAGSSNLCHVVGTQSSEGIKFSAARAPITAPRKSCQDFLQQSIAWFGNQGSLAGSSFSQIEGRDAVTFTVRDAASTAFIRDICLTNGSLVMTVEFPKLIRAVDVKPLAVKFFTSARIEDQLPDPPHPP